MKVLEIGMTNKVGGVEKYFYNYYENTKKYVHFDFINIFDRICYQEEYQSGGCKVFNVPTAKRRPLKYYNMLKKIIYQNKYDIVHINMLSAANILPILAARKCKTRVVVHSHNANVPKGLLRKILHKLNRKIVKKYATDFFACSKKAGEWLFGTDSQFTLILNAIDIAKYKYNLNIHKQVREELEIQDDCFLVGHVGRYSEQKNHKYLLDIFSEFRKKHNNSKLLLVGNGDLEEEINSKIEKLGLRDDIIKISYTDTPERYYQAMDIFLLPSLFEGLSLVSVEAQASGLPCICSDTISKETKITDYCDFIGIENDDIQLWVEKIEEYFNFTKEKRKDNLILDKRYDLKYSSEILYKAFLKICNDDNK